MISQWKVIKYVANRYGDHEDSFDTAREKLNDVREGKRQLTSLEENTDRVQKRLLREPTHEIIALERINGTTDFQDVSILDMLLTHSTSVCRILRNGEAHGTGFLVANEILLTNHHVIERESDAAAMLAEFNYQLDTEHIPQKTSTFRLNADKFFLTSSLEFDKDIPNSGLDFTLIGIDPIGVAGEQLSRFPAVLLDGNAGKIIKGENCILIQHPNGEYKKIVLKDTAFFSETGTRLVYESDTLPGASGSPVFALGTGELIALHHSGLPRTDAQNRVLTKSGTLAGPDTPDHEIDWIGNEGIKISCVVQAIRDSTLPVSMEPLREMLLRKSNRVAAQLNVAQAIRSTTSVAITTTPYQAPATTPQTNQPMPAENEPSTENLLYFEVLLSDNRTLRDDWEERAQTLVPGFVRTQPLISIASDPVTERMEYLTVSSTQNPWTLAAGLESLPHIESCTPDLETVTDVGIAEQKAAAPALTESVILNDGTAEINEQDFFIPTWKDSHWYKQALNINPNYIRQWNWLAVNCPQDISRTNGDWITIRNNLPALKLVQLDTGYTQHSKSFEGYDLTSDFDFIDDDNDAQDRVKEFSSRFLLKYPSHGTRTASLVIGGKLSSDPLGLDGNSGLLTLQDSRPTRLIPYRVAKSVILIGRGKEVVNAASHAIQNSADVMFMCMGTYPRPMLEAIALEAYKNGVIWVCAAGNEVELVIAPAMYPGTIAVAATNPSDNPWKGSSNGPAVDIAAPGESVYVPFADKNGNEIMVYGDGTSYATPHVASAAMLWKAKYKDTLNAYPEKWQIVEAFRHCLTESARKPENWPERNYTLYGKGILNIEKLLATEPPPADTLKNVYKNNPAFKKHDLGIKEAVHFIWNVIKRKVKAGPTESFTSPVLTSRGKATLNAFASAGVLKTTESTGTIRATEATTLLRDYFGQ